MTVHIEDVLIWMVGQKGDRYIFGAEAKATDPNPSAFDCSELVEWACARCDVQPRMPDGAFNQWKHCTPISVEQGMATRGALLFVGDGTGSGRDAITHVAGSLGDGTTIEARGSKWGIGTWPSVHRFNFAGLIPGVDYSPGHGQLPPAPPPVSGDNMKERVMALPLLKQGSSGQYVRNMQGLLSANGQAISIDGAFGPNTAKGLKAWQGRAGLTADGICGPASWSRLVGV